MEQVDCGTMTTTAKWIVANEIYIEYIMFLFGTEKLKKNVIEIERFYFGKTKDDKHRWKNWDDRKKERKRKGKNEMGYFSFIFLSADWCCIGSFFTLLLNSQVRTIRIFRAARCLGKAVFVENLSIFAEYLKMETFPFPY